MKAAMHNKMDCARVLIDAGADLNHHTKHRKHTALMLAAQRGHAEMCELLVERGANIFMVSPLTTHTKINMYNTER